jgi:hypothetical protein
MELVAIATGALVIAAVAAPPASTPRRDIDSAPGSVFDMVSFMLQFVCATPRSSDHVKNAAAPEP